MYKYEIVFKILCILGTSGNFYIIYIYSTFIYKAYYNTLYIKYIRILLKAYSAIFKHIISAFNDGKNAYMAHAKTRYGNVLIKMFLFFGPTPL